LVQDKKNLPLWILGIGHQATAPFPAPLVVSLNLKKEKVNAFKKLLQAGHKSSLTLDKNVSSQE